MTKPKRQYLTAQQVREIRNAAQTGESQKSIALRFGVSAACICRVLKGQRHKDA